MPARDMTAYMRKRRARFKAQGLTSYGTPRKDRKAPHPTPLGRPLTVWEKVGDAEFDAIEVRGGSPEWDNARSRWRDASTAPGPSTALSLPSGSTRGPSPNPSAVLTPTAQPKPPATICRSPTSRPSTFASGGTPPGPPVRAVAAEASAAWRANMQAMVAALVARSDAQERRIAALEAEAEARRAIEAKAVERKAIADGFFGLLGAAAAMLA